MLTYFTQAIPGVLEYQGARIQLLDLPGIVEGASQGRGRGRQVVSTAKTADLILPITTPTPSVEDNIASVPPDVTVSFLSEEINISP